MLVARGKGLLFVDNDLSVATLCHVQHHFASGSSVWYSQGEVL